jgi:adenylyl-sulfate kinase
VVHLDGDQVREGLCRDLGFSEADRHENNRRVAEIAKLLNRSGLVVLVSMISPVESHREEAREIIGADRYIEIFVDAPLNVCEERDPKGLYKKARQGEIADFTGLGFAYERPKRPDLVLRTDKLCLEEAGQQLLQFLRAPRT